jgi:hypothetical protein
MPALSPTRRSLLLGTLAGPLAGLDWARRPGLPAALAQNAPAPAARPAAPALVPRRLYFEEPERMALRLSPRGAMLAWLAPVDGVRNLWVAPADDPGQARPATRVTDRALSPSFNWAWTEKHVIVFREREGDENWRAVGVDIETGAMVPLTPERGVRAFHQQRARRFPTEMLFAHNGRDKRFFDLHRVDITTGASTLVYENNEYHRFYTDTRFDLRFAVRTRRDGSKEVKGRKADGSFAHFMDIPL